MGLKRGRGVGRLETLNRCGSDTLDGAAVGPSIFFVGVWRGFAARGFAVEGVMKSVMGFHMRCSL